MWRVPFIVSWDVQEGVGFLCDEGAALADALYATYPERHLYVNVSTDNEQL